MERTTQLIRDPDPFNNRLFMLQGIFASVLVVLSQMAIGQEPIPAKDSLTGNEIARAKFILNGIQRERNRLKSGVCHVKGTVDHKSTENPTRDISGPTEILIAFDASGKTRLDRKEPSWIIDEPTSKAIKGSVAGKSYRDAKNFVYWIVGSESIQIWPAQKKVQWRVLRSFDVKTLGLAGHVEEEQGRSLEQIILDLSRVSPTIDDSNPKEWLATWNHHGPPKSQWRLWIAPEEGFSIVRGERREMTASSANWNVDQTFETKWGSVGNVWVPTYNKMMAKSSQGILSHTRELNLVWDSVNLAIDDSLFDYRSFGAPPAIGVIDHSLGRPVVIRDSGVTPSEAADVSKAGNKSSRLLWFALAVVLGTIVCVGFWLRKRSLA